MSKSKESRTSAMWYKEITLIFCDLCVKEVELGNRPTTFFNKEGWNTITLQFKELTGRNYDRMKLKNKWDQLKKDWKIWKELKRGSTGLGWDPVKRTIDASEEWWAHKIEMVPAAKKFKFSGIDPVLEEKLDGMFIGVVSTGPHAFTPTGQNFGGLTHDTASEHIANSGKGPSHIQTEVQSTGGTKRHRADKKKVGASFVRGSIETILEFCKPNTAPSQPIPTTCDFSIQKCLRILNTYPDVKEDEPLYLKYVKLLGNSTRRQFFANLDPDFRLSYLRSFMTD